MSLSLRGFRTSNLASGSAAPDARRFSTLRPSSPRGCPRSLRCASASLSSRSLRALPSTANHAALPCSRTALGATTRHSDPCQPRCADRTNSTRSNSIRNPGTWSGSSCKGQIVNDETKGGRQRLLPPLRAESISSRSITNDELPWQSKATAGWRPATPQAGWLASALIAAVTSVLFPLPVPLLPPPRLSAHIPSPAAHEVAEQRSAGGATHSTLSELISSLQSGSRSTALAVPFSGASAPLPSETFDNVPQTLSEEDRKPRRIQKPKSPTAEKCLRKCVGTCIRGGAGAPGEGPINVERPIVVFKSEFRSRQYCLVECSEICNLLPDGKSKP